MCLSDYKFKWWLTRNEVYEHLILKQFPVGYTRWIWHGESSVMDTSNSRCHANEPSTSQSSENSIQNMINYAFGISRHHLCEPSTSLEQIVKDEGINLNEGSSDRTREFWVS